MRNDSTPTDDTLALLAQLMEQEGIASSSIPTWPDDRPAPASFAQETIWLLDRASPGLTAYNLAFSRRVRGPLDRARLQRALDRLIERHLVLRTTFVSTEQGTIQDVLPARPATLAIHDVSDVPAATRETEAAAILRRAVRTAFDLARDQLLRGTLVLLAPDDALLVLESHHIALDGAGLGLLFKELAALYADPEADLAAPALQFRHVAAWQRQELAGPRGAALLEYWRGALGEVPASLDLPTDFPRRATPAFEGATVGVTLPPAAADGIKRMAKRQGATLYMALLAAYQTVLHRWSGQNAIVTGSASAGRIRPELEPVIGYLANTLALLTRFDDDPTFATLLDRVRDTALGAFDHQEMPLEWLMTEIRRDTGVGAAPLFQTVLTMQETGEGGTFELPGLRLEPAPLSGGATKFDLTLFPSERPEGLRLTLSYRTDLFTEATAQRFLGHVAAVLEAAVADPARRVSELPMVRAEELAQLAGWQGAPQAFPETPVPSLIAARAAASPGATAVVSGDAALSYGALQSRAAALGGALMAAGVAPGDRVGLFLDRTAELLAGVQGIWLAGAGYVPLLPDLPPARLATLLAESGARVVVTTAALRGALPSGTTAILIEDAAAPALAPLPGARPEGLAYVLFTSGSTGVPKGVAVTHANLAHYVQAISARLGLRLDGTTPWTGASVSTLAADLGHTAVFPILSAGGTLHLVPTAVTMEPARWAEYTARHHFDLLKITPSHLKALIGDAAGAALAALLPRRWLVLGGEACPPALAAAIQSAGAGRVLNHYGPTETTVGACTYAPDEETAPAETVGSVPIGRPLPNLRAEVRNPAGQQQPVGVPGELWLGGPQVAQGYLGRPDLTAERFVTDAGGVRWYRTGDRVRRVGNGALEFLGRLDAQVKVRGHRVELEEIERVIAAVPGVRQAAVRLAGEVLAGYVVADAAVTDAQLTGAVRTALPDYMVPATWTRLERMPLNANGKLDRAQLPEGQPAADGPGAAPRGATEIQLAALWAEVLKRDGIGREDNFFALGGHSLLAIRLLGRISKQFGVRLPLRALFEAPTVAALAALVTPAHPLEAPLAALWQEVLRREPIGRDENFFAIGGHSLLAIRLLGRISKQLGVRLPLRALFEAPTLAQLAPAVGAAQAGAPPAAAGQPVAPAPARGGITKRERTRTEPPQGGQAK